MKRYAVLLILLPVYVGMSPVRTISRNISDDLVTRFRVDHPGTAFAFGFQEGGKTEVRCFPAPGSADRPDSNSVFHLGRLTSLWTTAMAVACARDGILSLDAPVSDYLPVAVPAPVYQRLGCQPVRRTEQAAQPDDPRFTPYICLPDPSDRPQPILLCYLTTHTSGLPDRPFNLETRNGVPDYPGFTVGSLYKFLSVYRPEQPIGFDYAYSDLGLVLLGHVLQRRSGVTFDSLFSRSLARPLGLTSSRLPGGNGPGEYGLYAAAIGGEASFSDLMRFLDANIRPSGPTGQVLEYMHEPRLRIRENEEVALGWDCRTYAGSGRRVIFRSDTFEGQTVFMALEESSHSGFVLAGSGSGLHALGMQLMYSLYSKTE